MRIKYIYRIKLGEEEKNCALLVQKAAIPIIAKQLFLIDFFFFGLLIYNFFKYQVMEIKGLSLFVRVYMQNGLLKVLVKYFSKNR